MEKNIYTVMYFGNAKKYQDLRQEIAAFSKREAVERFYASFFDENYFPNNPNVEFGGYVFDCDKNLIAYPGGEGIEYDGGYFYAELKLVK
jgi:hypothetical protein